MKYKENKIYAKPSDILFDSESDSFMKYRLPENFKNSEEPWKKNVMSYRLLNSDQILKLEKYFIENNLKFNKVNIRKMSKNLKMPYNRALNYIYNKYKNSEKSIINYNQNCLNQLKAINEKIDKMWMKYINEKNND